MATLLVRLRGHDERALHALVRRRHRLLDRSMSAVTHLGDTTTVVGISAALSSGLLPGTAEAGRATLLLLTLSHLVVQLLKRGISRARPALPVGIEFLVHPPDRFSFPSGHAAAALSVAIGVSVLLPAALAAGIVLLGAGVGLSRCYLGVHYPGDVLVAWAITLLCACGLGILTL